MSTPGYIRPSTTHFAHRVVRAMTKSCAAHQIGPEGFALVTMIGHQWDTIRYSRPVTYRIAHLMNLLAIKSVDGFYRLERKCIAAGWLMKHSPGRRLPPAYWVAIPESAMELPDTVTDDHDEPDQEPIRNENGMETGTQTEPNRNPTGTQPEPKRNPSTLDPIPNPLPGDRDIAPAAPPRGRPTLAMVEEYCAERGNGVDPERWMAHYEANGWKVGRNSMRDWRAAVRTWETGDRKPGAKASGDGMSWSGPLPSPEEARRALGLTDG